MQIEFFCDDAAVVEFFSPKPANKVVPEWYRDLPTWKKNPFEGVDAPTIKNCMPAQDMLLAGYIIFNTYELTLVPESKTKYQEFQAICPHRPHISSHHHEQMPVSIAGEKKHYFKVAQPWIIKTPPGYSCIIQQPFYHFEQRYQILPAIVDTDQHDLNIEIPGFLLSDEPVKIESGAPFIQVIPFKREDWTMSAVHQPRKRSRLEFLWQAAYRTVFHSKKNFK